MSATVVALVEEVVAFNVVPDVIRDHSFNGFTKRVEEGDGSISARIRVIWLSNLLQDD